jgi:hypothetical protein
MPILHYHLPSQKWIFIITSNPKIIKNFIYTKNSLPNAKIQAGVPRNWKVRFRHVPSHIDEMEQWKNDITTLQHPDVLGNEHVNKLCTKKIEEARVNGAERQFPLNTNRILLMSRHIQKRRPPTATTGFFHQYIEQKMTQKTRKLLRKTTRTLQCPRPQIIDTEVQAYHQYENVCPPPPLEQE